MRFDCTYTTSLVNWLTQRGCLTSNVITDLPCADLVTYIQGVQLKSGPLTKPGIYHVRRYLLWFCWYDIILLHVQELARLLQERGESVLVICISWISRRWVLVFEQCHFLHFHNAVNNGRTCIYFGKLFKKRCLTSIVDKVFLKNLEGNRQWKVLLRKWLKMKER